MTAAYYGTFRPPCAPWATRADIEAALSVGYPLDPSYTQRALDLSHELLEGPNSEIVRLRCKLDEAREAALSAEESADEAERAHGEADQEIRRLRKIAERFVARLPPPECWEAMQMFCNEVDLSDIPVIEIATLEGKELRHAHQVRVIGARYRLGKALQGHTEARLVGLDYGSGITRMLLAPATPPVLGADFNPLAWLMTEHQWKKDHALDLVAVPASCFLRSK